SGWLRTEIERLRVVVGEAETAVANFKVNNDLFVGSNNTSLPDQQLSTIAAQISAAQERRNTAASRAALIRGMLERGQSIEGVADVRESVVIQQLSQEKARLQGEKAQRSATLLGNHPTIQALTAQIAELNNQIALEGRRVADALLSESQIEADLEASLQAGLTRAKATASMATQDNVTLDGLQREAKAQRDLLEGYLQRYNEAFSRTESNSALPDVRVVSIAAPSVTPASPKTQLILIAVAIVSLLLQIGLIAFGELMSGRAIAYAPQLRRAQDELDEVPFIADELEPDQRWEQPVAETPAAQVRPQPAYVEPPPAVPMVAGPVDVPSAIAEPAIDLEPEARPGLLAQSDAIPVAEPESAAQPALFVPAMEDAGMTTLSELSSDLVYGHSHLLLLAAHSANTDCEALAEELIGDALSRGLSVALIDAGSSRPCAEMGLSDLSADQASFGDVVQKSADNSFAEVPWGRLPAIEHQSGKPLTLVEALGDIYEVVIVLTGRLGPGSTLPLFESLDGRLVLIAGDADDFTEVSTRREQLLEAGFTRVDIAAVPARAAA
ncbi:MAG: hypothetical protein JWP99_626, partial [Devosia sp.]|nr:hypothetical protein [Devosia sp.]